MRTESWKQFHELDCTTVGRQASESFFGELGISAIFDPETFVHRYDMHCQSVFPVELAPAVRTRIWFLFCVGSLVSGDLKGIRTEV